MTIKSLPVVKAFEAPTGGSYETPSGVIDHWRDIKAADDSGQNTLNIYGEIGENWDGTGTTARLVGAVLRRAKGEDVSVNINSPGGDFFEGVAIYNMLREYDGRVNVNVIGLAASAASVIAMAADDLKIAKAGFMMIHNSWGMVVGNQNDMREAAETFAVFDKAMAAVYADRSGLDQEEIAKMMDSDTMMSGEQAVELGLANSFVNADEIIEDESKTTSAKHRIDKILAKHGIPRSERRSMFKEIASTQNATGTATQDASDLTGVMKALDKLSNIVKGS